MNADVVQRSTASRYGRNRAWQDVGHEVRQRVTELQTQTASGLDTHDHGTADACGYGTRQSMVGASDARYLMRKNDDGLSRRAFNVQHKAEERKGAARMWRRGNGAFTCREREVAKGDYSKIVGFSPGIYAGIPATRLLPFADAAWLPRPSHGGSGIPLHRVTVWFRATLVASVAELRRLPGIVQLGTGEAPSDTTRALGMELFA